MEYYGVHGDGRLIPCYGNALVCSRLADIAPTGVAFCQRMGLNPMDEDEGNACFDGSVSLDKGQPEPTEPIWHELGRLLEDPNSGAGMIVAVVVVMLLVLWKTTAGAGWVKQQPYNNIVGGEVKSMDAIRQRQQDEYLASLLPQDDDDSSSEEEREKDDTN